MTSKEKWNFIVGEYKKLYNEKEEAVDSRWRQYCQGLFGYNDLFGEIKSQASIRVGVHDHAIPDIILCIDGNDILDIELKQYSFDFENKFENQLISYLKLTHLSVGMVICKEIYVFSYNYTKDEVKKVSIPFVEDNADGIALVDLLQRDTFTPDAIHEFVNQKLNKENRIKEIQERITDDLLLSLLNRHFSKTYSDDEIAEALDDYIISIKKNGTVKLCENRIYAPLNVDDNMGERIAVILKNWCNKKQNEGALNLDLSKCTNSCVRFTTDAMDSVIPTPDIGKSGWNNNHFYYYEIWNRNSNIFIILVFSRQNAPVKILDSFSKVFRCTDKYPKKDDWQWKTIFRSNRVKIKEEMSEDIINKMLDGIFSEIIQEQANIVNKICNTY